MADETQVRGVNAVDTSALDAGGSAAPDAQAYTQDGARPGRRPYLAPQLRYLGKVADLTFGATGSKTDAGKRVGHNHKKG